MNYKTGAGAIVVLSTVVLIGFVGFWIYSENRSKEEVIADNFFSENDDFDTVYQQQSFSSNIQEVVTPQQTTNVVNNSSATNIIVANTSTETTNIEQTENDEYVCPLDDTPFFFITSPNGGEEYQVGQSITVTWESCNIPPTAIFSGLNFVHQNDATKNKRLWVAGGEAGWAGMPSPLNDGIEIIPLANTQTGIIVEPGTYKICMNGVWLGNTPPGQGISISDCSDGTFVVN